MFGYVNLEGKVSKSHSVWFVEFAGRNAPVLEGALDAVGLGVRFEVEDKDFGVVRVVGLIGCRFHFILLVN